MSRHSKKNGIPDRWLDYTAVGKRLPGTRFIAFKVPLKESLNRQLSCSDVFGPWELQDALSKQDQQLGLIIDLTFTTRYYKLQDIPQSLLCVKIFTAGHEIPSDETILRFKRVVHRFLKDNEDNDQLIGVHCTHGLNRTGYLICRYLIDVDGMDPQEAVELFNSSRGHNMERQNYLEDLHRGPKRSNEGMDECGQEPQRGQAAQKPCYFSSDNRDERRGRDLNHSWNHRPSPPWGSNHRFHHRFHQRPPHDGLLPAPPPLPPPLPHFRMPSSAPLLHPYRWTPPQPDAHWRRTPYSEDRRSRCPPPDCHLQEDRRRAPPLYLPPPPHPPLLHHYSHRWNSNGCDEPEDDWTAPRSRHSHRHTHRHRVDGYDNDY